MQKCKKAQKSAQGVEKKGDSSSKRWKPEGRRTARQVGNPGIFWKESANRADGKEKATKALAGLWPNIHNSCYHNIQDLSSKNKVFRWSGLRPVSNDLANRRKQRGRAHCVETQSSGRISRD